MKKRASLLLTAYNTCVAAHGRQVVPRLAYNYCLVASSLFGLVALLFNIQSSRPLALLNRLDSRAHSLSYHCRRLAASGPATGSEMMGRFPRRSLIGHQGQPRFCARRLMSGIASAAGEEFEESARPDMPKPRRRPSDTRKELEQSLREN
jgi:hypothetical protein